MLRWSNKLYRAFLVTSVFFCGAIARAQGFLPLDSKATGVNGDALLTGSTPGPATWRLREGIEKATLSFDLDALPIRLRDFDEIHLRFKPRDSI